MKKSFLLLTAGLVAGFANMRSKLLKALCFNPT